MIVTQADIDAIRSRRIRKRTLELPVRKIAPRDARHPRTGRVLRVGDQAHSGAALARCPMRFGGKYTLRAATPYAQNLTVAEREPSRARAVLLLFDLCDRKTRSVTVTVVATPERCGDVWLVRFEKGDIDVRDRSVFLAKYGDYTMTQSRQAVPGDPEVQFPLEDDLEKARQRAREGLVAPQREALDKLSMEVATCAQAMRAMKARNRLRLALKEIEKARAELAADGPVMVSDQSVRAARQASAA